MRKISWHGLVVIVCAIAVGAGTSLAGQQPLDSFPMRYAPPETTFNGGNQLQLLQGEIDQKQFDAAATRIDSLLRESGDALMSQGEDGSVISINSWMQNLPVQTKTLLSPAYESAVGAEAQQAVERAAAKADSDPGELYELSRRYPFSRAASASLMAAARRSATLADLPAARWMLDAAVAGESTGDANLGHQIDQANAATNGIYCGALPFSASWYGLKTRHAWAAIRSFPASAAGDIFVAGPGQVIAIRENGSVMWKGPTGEEPIAGRGASGPMGVTRAPPFSPALFCDTQGDPQLLIVRQPQVHSDGWALRALRAEDGHLLWTTEGQEDFHGLAFGSNPAVVGRYVYAVAGEMTDQLDHLYLVAIELTTGKQLWRCDIGTVSRIIAPRGKNQPATEVYRPWLNESAPCVDGDVLIASPNVGAVIAAGRFDGKLRWSRLYTTLPDPTVALSQQRDRALRYPASEMPLLSGLSMRWANTPAASGGIVLCAPEDSDQVIALSESNGNVLWQSADFANDTLIGQSGGIAVMAGETNAGLQFDTNKPAWKRPATDATGPSVLHGDLILTMTSHGLAASTVANGTPAVAPKVPAFDAAIQIQPARNVLSDNDAAHCFGSRGGDNPAR